MNNVTEPPQCPAAGAKTFILVGWGIMTLPLTAEGDVCDYILTIWHFHLTETVF